MACEEDVSQLDERIGPIDFSTFIISLASSVAMHLNPTHKAYDLGLARQTIDIIAMLRDKTAGNLTSEETQLISGVLYEARMAFCDASKSPC